MDIGKRTIGNFVFTVIVDLIWLAILAVLLYSIGALAWAMISNPM